MPLFWLSISFILGIWLGELSQFPIKTWLLVGTASLGLLPLEWAGRQMVVQWPGLLRAVLSAFTPHQLRMLLRPVNGLRSYRLGISLPWLLAALCLGAVRFTTVQALFSPDHLAGFNDFEKPVSLEGVVVEPPDVRDSYTNLVLWVQRVRPPGGSAYQETQGRVLARLDPGGEWRYGDQLRLAGRLVTPGEDDLFSYRQYLAQRGIFSLLVNVEAKKIGSDQAYRFTNPLLAALTELRSRSQAVIYRLYPDPEASLLAGVLLGLEGGIPVEVSQAFKVTGTAHIIAISGFNMALLTGLVASGLAKKRWSWAGVCVAACLIGLYTLLVGAQAAVVRAALMAGLSVFASQVGRRQHGINSLVFIAAVMAGIHPYVLWDVSFQLSASATPGLMLFLINGSSLPLE